MTDINVVIGGKQYRMACEDGQEERLRQLANAFGERIADLQRRFGEIGDARLLVMAALMVSDELLDARRQVERLEDEIGHLRRDKDALGKRPQEIEKAVTAALNAASQRLEQMAEVLKAGPGGAGIPLG